MTDFGAPDPWKMVEVELPLTEEQLMVKEDD